MTNEQQKLRMKAKNKLMLFVLMGLCLLFYGLTIAKLKGF
jgi:hypothetical protein